jgi:drug/metabolite transporter (DMT)-like permease
VDEGLRKTTRVVALTAFTLMAFAGNSLLARTALGHALIDPVTFTILRLVSGALALLPISRLFGNAKTSRLTGSSWKSGFALFVYAFYFSLAYVSISAGTGALLLFGCVQVTMIGAALRSGERLTGRQWMGLATALGGLTLLMLPGVTAPTPRGAFQMCVAGIAWGIYSLRGKGALSPAYMTAGNFLRSLPFLSIVILLPLASFHTEPTGVLLAVVSGVVTSGLGYILWYEVLKYLSTTQASVVQLLVPALAAFGGVLFLSESVSVRLIAASVLILGGVATTVLARKVQRGP